MHALSFDEVIEDEETLFAGFCFDSRNMNLQLRKMCGSNPSCFSFVFARNSIRLLLLRRWERIDFADSEIRSGTCSRVGEVSLGVGSCHLTEFSVIAPVVQHSMECE